MQDIFDQINNRPQGHSLPPDCYTDDQFLHREVEKLYLSEWHCLGREDEVSEVGDYFTIELIDEPLLVVRQSESQINVLSNVCRHRGMPVATGVGNTARFVCPYHAWSYKLDGRLRHAPLIPKHQLDKNCGLPVLQSRCWQGFIFVSLAADAAWPGDHTREESLSELEHLVGNYHMQAMHQIAHFTETWQCNWKSLVENFMDAYHLSVVHPETLHHLTPTSLSKKAAGSESFTAYTANYADTAPVRQNHHPSLTQTQSRQSQLFCIFPALIASVSADTLVYFALQPQGVSKVVVKWGIACFESDLAQPEMQARIDKWQQINREDHQILKRLQQGLNSKNSSTGPLAEDNFEGTLSDFHHYLTVKLEVDRTSGS